MTLIVAIRCEAGVVVAADSTATFGAMGQTTIAQSTERKIEVVEGRALLGVSGAVGLAQRFRGELAGALLDNKTSQWIKGSDPWEVGVKLRELFGKHINQEMQTAAIARNAIGQGAMSSALSASVVAIVTKAGPTLIQFDQQGAPEEATEQLPFVCIGSGQPNADPFLAFVKEALWTPGKLPALEMGIVTALWTLRQTISVATGGIGGAIHVFTLTGDGTKYVAREVPGQELEEHSQAIDATQTAIRDFWAGRSPVLAAPPIPKA